MAYLHMEVNRLGKCLMALSETIMGINVIILNKIVKMKTFCRYLYNTINQSPQQGFPLMCCLQQHSYFALKNAVYKFFI